MVQRNFLRKIEGAHRLSYWDQLRKYKMYSLERRRERYSVIYVWKIIENLVPNFSHLEGDGNKKGGITWYNHIRLGRKCVTKSVKLGPFQQVRYSSLAVQGPKLFNSLPKHI